MERWIRAKYQPVLPLGADGSRVTECKTHIELSKEAAREGMVLLKNEGNILPLKTGVKVALFGKGTFDYVKGGGGSGDVTVSYTRNIYDGLKSLGNSVKIFEESAQFYKTDVERQYELGRVPGMLEEPKLPGELLEKAREYTDTAIISISRFSGEGWDRGGKILGDYGENSPERLRQKIFENDDFSLTNAEKAMVDAVKMKFRNVIVILNVGGMVDTEWFRNEERIQSVLVAWQGGMEGGTAAAELLAGKYNPCGKLSDTFARTLKDYPSTDGFHESEEYVNYTEDIYVGYRYFETLPGAGGKVNYPFGFGLSYTEFELSEIKASKVQDMIKISVNVCNVGGMKGKEVVQAYYSAPQGKLGKPARTLAAFVKTRLLKPGEMQRITLAFSVADMASYDDLGKVAKSAYVLEKGEYNFYVGTSVRDVLKAAYSLHIDNNIVVKQLTQKLAPVELKERLLADGTMENLDVCAGVSAPSSADNIFIPMTGEEADKVGREMNSKDPGKCRYMEEGAKSLNDVAEGKARLTELLAQLSDREVAELLGGQPNTGVANTFGLGYLPKYGIPNIMTADGPAGLRINKECGVCTTAWPCATLIACTWNPELAEKIGEAGGAEVKENNIGIWLTPALNIHRSPLCGRNFEYYSEDPYLTGKMASAMVRGIQSNSIAATVKHFALNNKETNRRDSDSRASERAIREVYLRAFEIVVKESDPWCLMTSYNLINGHRASESVDLIEGILRGEWNYKGMVTTDWGCLGEHYKEVIAGNDIKMGNGFPDRLMGALEKGAVTREQMETCVARILKLIMKIE